MRELPSGTVIEALRIVVPRTPSPMSVGAGRSRQTSDRVDCTAWGGRARRTVSRWRVGDTVEVEGALRRRIARSSGPVQTRLDVEVLAGRLVARGP